MATTSADTPARHGTRCRWPAVARVAGLLSRGDRPLLRFLRFSVVSGLSTLASQLTLVGLYVLDGRNAGVAGVAAFLAGAVPNFVLNRWWAWRRRGRPALRGELLPYAAVLLGGGLAAVLATTLVGWLLAPVIQDRSVRALLLGITYQGSFALLFVVKFLLLDRVVFARDPASAR